MPTIICEMTKMASSGNPFFTVGEVHVDLSNLEVAIRILVDIYGTIHMDDSFMVMTRVTDMPGRPTASYMFVIYAGLAPELAEEVVRSKIVDFLARILLDI